MANSNANPGWLEHRSQLDHWWIGLEIPIRGPHPPQGNCDRCPGGKNVDYLMHLVSILLRNEINICKTKQIIKCSEYSAGFFKSNEHGRSGRVHHLLTGMLVKVVTFEFSTHSLSNCSTVIQNTNLFISSN